MLGDLLQAGVRHCYGVMRAKAYQLLLRQQILFIPRAADMHRPLSETLFADASRQRKCCQHRGIQLVYVA